MGQVGVVKNKNLEKKYKQILESRDLIDDALDLDKKLKRIMDHVKDFDDEINPFKDKEQKKVRDFR